MEWTFLDSWIVITGALSAMACSLLGNFLVLRRMSMMGDAISHAVLPGLAIAFLITGSRESLPMLIGAVAIGVLTAFMVQGISKLSNLDKGATMGVVFTTLFALGLILIRQAADHVDLDPGCVLYGAIELTPLDTYDIFGYEIPAAALTNAGMLLLNSLFVIIFYKELKITTFDPALATTMGINANVMHYVLMTFVAATTVAAFESVGSILVIAMLIVPAACAHLLTDRLSLMLVISLIIALASAVFGHIFAITIPGWFGFRDTSTAGMMGVAAGVIFLLVFLFAPRHGLISRMLSQAMLALKITRDDILGFLYRYKELATQDSAPVRVDDLRQGLKLGFSVNLAMWDLRRKGRVTVEREALNLTPTGEQEGRGLIRSHRLWEAYLCDQFDACVADVHLPAHKLEHFTDPSMQSKLDQETGHAATDPHQRKIPDAT
jgi:manganese/zinc/iron transport system permease protein